METPGWGRVLLFPNLASPDPRPVGISESEEQKSHDDVRHLWGMRCLIKGGSGGEGAPLISFVTQRFLGGNHRSSPSFQVLVIRFKWTPAVVVTRTVLSMPQMFMVGLIPFPVRQHFHLNLFCQMKTRVKPGPASVIVGSETPPAARTMWLKGKKTNRLQGPGDYDTQVYVQHMRAWWMSRLTHEGPGDHGLSATNSEAVRR